MPDYNYAADPGWNVTSPTNIETLIDEPPHTLPDQLMPEMGPVKTRALSGKARRDGVREMAWGWDKLLRTNFDILVAHIWGDYQTTSVKATIITRGADNQYTTYNVYAEQPVAGEDYEIVPGSLYLRNVVIRFYAATAFGAFDSGFSLGFEV